MFSARSRDRVAHEVQTLRSKTPQRIEELRGLLAEFYAKRTLTHQPIDPQDCAAAILFLAGRHVASHRKSDTRQLCAPRSIATNASYLPAAASFSLALPRNVAALSASAKECFCQSGRLRESHARSCNAIAAPPEQNRRRAILRVNRLVGQRTLASKNSASSPRSSSSVAAFSNANVCTS